MDAIRSARAARRARRHRFGGSRRARLVAGGAARALTTRPDPRPITLSDPETLGVVAHELRTPITTLFVGSKLLQEDRLSRRSRSEVVDALAEEAERLRDFVEDLIALAGAEDPGPQESEPVLVQRVLPAVVQDEASRVPGTRFRSFVPRDLPPVIADEVALRRLLRTIVSTAADLGRARALVEIVARPVEGAIRIRALVRHVQLADAQVAAFFETVPTRPAERRPGTQFRLAAAQATAVQLGGSTWVRRQRNGVEVGVELPADLADERDEPEGVTTSVRS